MNFCIVVYNFYTSHNGNMESFNFSSDGSDAQKLADDFETTTQGVQGQKHENTQSGTVKLQQFFCALFRFSNLPCVVDCGSGSGLGLVLAGIKHLLFSGPKSVVLLIGCEIVLHKAQKSRALIRVFKFVERKVQAEIPE
jgi:hypothetical protein